MGPFKSTGANFTSPSPTDGQELNRTTLTHRIDSNAYPPVFSLPCTLSLSFTHTHTHTHTHSKTACLKVGGRSRVSISGELPEEASGTGNLLPSPSPVYPRLSSHEPTLDLDHPLCSAPGQDTLLFLTCSPSAPSPNQPLAAAAPAPAARG